MQETKGTVLVFLYLIKYTVDMRLPRRTYDGAFHHAMNRGYEGRPIFGSAFDKEFILTFPAGRA
jgi:hypothetical protein